MSRKYYIENGEAIPAIKFEETAPEGYSLISDFETLKELHAHRYEKNRQDGVKYYNNFQASLYLDIVSGVFTVLEVVTFEAYIESLSKQIIAGSWLTAQNTITNLALSGIFNQDMKDKIMADINNYVLENY